MFQDNFFQKVEKKTNINKETITVDITKLKKSYGEINNLIAYETNITNISNCTLHTIIFSK